MILFSSPFPSSGESSSSKKPGPLQVLQRLQRLFLDVLRSLLRLANVRSSRSALTPGRRGRRNPLEAFRSSSPRQKTQLVGVFAAFVIFLSSRGGAGAGGRPPPPRELAYSELLTLMEKKPENLLGGVRVSPTRWDFTVALPMDHPAKGKPLLVLPPSLAAATAAAPKAAPAVVPTASEALAAAAAADRASAAATAGASSSSSSSSRPSLIGGGAKKVAAMTTTLTQKLPFSLPSLPKVSLGKGRQAATTTATPTGGEVRAGAAAAAAGAAGEGAETGFKAVRFYSRPVSCDPYAMNLLRDQGILFGARSVSKSVGLLRVLFPVLYFGLIWTAYQRMMGKGASGKAGNRLAPTALPAGSGFTQVAGVGSAKQEVAEIVQMLRDPRRFAQAGARLPSGILLVGPPGTGKTLLARAVAAEAGVPFFYCSGSDFIEMFVGRGAARVRQLFKTAKKASPCILFVDELDAIGKIRNTNSFSIRDNSEAEQTLNQLLAAMDGIDTSNDGVVVLAATNRFTLLDEALTRPGRFDRVVKVPLPVSWSWRVLFRFRTSCLRTTHLEIVHHQMMPMKLNS